MIPIFCDMDGVLVHQTGRDGFDVMPWSADGKTLWAFIAPYKPTILSMLPRRTYDHCAPQKRTWCGRELGADVPVIVTPDDIGKGPHATPGAILIDDAIVRHEPAWTKSGGVFVHHTSARETIRRLQTLLK